MITASVSAGTSVVKSAQVSDAVTNVQGSTVPVFVAESLLTEPC
jgi:hypothetical protein